MNHYVIHTPKTNIMFCIDYTSTKKMNGQNLNMPKQGRRAPPYVGNIRSEEVLGCEEEREGPQGTVLNNLK